MCSRQRAGSAAAGTIRCSAQQRPASCSPTPSLACSALPSDITNMTLRLGSDAAGVSTAAVIMPFPIEVEPPRGN